MTEKFFIAGNSSSNFLYIDFEKKPLTVDADYGVTVNLEPMEIIYHEVRLGEAPEVLHFELLQKNINRKSLRAAKKFKFQKTRQKRSHAMFVVMPS